MVGVKETVHIGTLWTLRKKDSLPAATRSGGRRSQSQALLASATLVAATCMAYHHESRRLGMVKIGMTMLKTTMMIFMATAEKNLPMGLNRAPMHLVYTSICVGCVYIRTHCTTHLPNYIVLKLMCLSNVYFALFCSSLIIHMCDAVNTIPYLACSLGCWIVNIASDKECCSEWIPRRL